MHFREVCLLDDRFEADIVEEALEEEGIEFRMVGSEETTMQSVYAIQKAWGVVLVPEDQVDRAIHLIKKVMAAKPETPEAAAARKDTAPRSGGLSRGHEL